MIRSLSKQDFRLTWAIRLVLGAVGAAVLLSLGACSDSGHEDLLDKARAAISEGKTADATVHLKAYLQQSPESPRGRHLFGQALLRSQDYAGALVELERARALGVSHEELALDMALALNAVGRGGEVLERFHSLVLEDPLARGLLKTQVALAYLAGGDVALATDAVESALQADPQLIPARVLRARLVATAGDVPAAIKLTDEVLSQSPDAPDALRFRAELALTAERSAGKAVQLLERLLSSSPKDVLAHMLTLEAAVLDRDISVFAARLAAMERALPGHPETLYAQARHAVMRNDGRAARQLAERLALLAPDNSRVLLLAGVIETQFGSLQVAETHLTKAVQLNPSSSPARLSLARVHLRLGQPRRALDGLGPLLSAETEIVEALKLAGEAEMLLGNSAAAERMYRRAVGIRPDDASVRAALATTKIARGRIDEGLGDLAALSAQDRDTSADLALIAAHLAQGRLAQASSAITTLESKVPDSPLPHVLRGRIELQAGNLALARASFVRAQETDPSYYPSVAGQVEIDISEGDLSRARERLESHLSTVPTNNAALFQLFQVLVALQESPEKIKSLLEDAVRARPSEVAPRLLLVEHHLQQRDLAAARTSVQQATAAIPSNADLEDALGRVMLALGDSRQAVAAFGRAANLRPGSAAAHLRLGDAQLRAGDIAAGRSSLERARQIDPQSVDAQRAVLNVALQERRYPEALRIAREVQQRQPRAPIGYLLEADVHLNQRNIPEALRLVREAHAREPSSDLAVRVHGLQVLANQPAEADRFAADWLRRNPQDVQFHGHLGTQALQRGDFAAAERQYQRVLELKPDDPVALNNVAWSMLQLGRPEPAVPLARRANEVLPNQPALQNTLATALKATGNLREAADWQRRSVASSNGEPRYRLQLAEMLLALNERGPAREELRVLEALGDGFPQRDKVLELARQAR